MQIKNNIIFLFIVCVLNLSFLTDSNLWAEEFDIEAKEITVDKQNNIVICKGSVIVKDSDGTTIKSDKVIYEKSKEFLTLEGSVKIFDQENNLVTTNKATYDKNNEIINTYENSNIILKEGYNLSTNYIF